ncbi:DNA/RNA nuclease SfsA [Pseudoalteromonas luteoviolacea]|uniref:DNA/RNA nuclease SfsA n=1 Tax=Pseudoalteromonas luteoviolacea TaxID=43657 RepID=UPI001B36C144|nr:DNA/RNA nuclease SfsA [Pseudoalteromonas luteoviolacea]MBQ4813640.1 DNA/RNA nuclease SfsA [Pseudoalteromonas luteoviolacea]
MKFSSELKSATLLKRYKRFLVDLRKDNGDEFTVHCANTGKMTGCADSGFKAYYSTSSNAKRKYPHSLEVTENAQGQLICVNTGMANKVAIEAIEQNLIPELSAYQNVASEVKYGHENSRIDILLSSEGQADCYVEVKSVTLLETQGQGFFPDAETLRGQKHLRELMHIAQSGQRAVLLFIVMHNGIENVKAAKHIDKKYAQLLTEARQQGVEIYAYKAQVTPQEVKVIKQLSVLDT